MSRRDRKPQSVTLKGAVLPGIFMLCRALTSYAAPPPEAAPEVATAAQPSNAGAIGQLLDSARMWRNKFRNDLALQMVQKALLLSPNNPNALAELGQIQIRSNQLQEASHLLFRLRAMSPNAEATRELGYAYMAATTGKQELAAIYLLSRSKPAEAVQRLQALFSEGPPKGDLAAQYYSLMGADPAHRASAILALRRILAADRNNLNAALTLASLLNRENATRMESAKLAQRTALNPDADRQAALNIWRRILRDAGADPDYIDLQQSYLEAVPDDTEFKDLLAASQAALQARLKLEADPAWQNQQQGLKLLGKGALAEADPLLTKALPSRGADPELLGGLGLLRMRQGRHAEARAFFLEAARVDPARRAGWESQARTALFWGTLSQAREAVTRGSPAQAETAARAALAIQPNNLYARKLLADALVAQRRWADAEPLLRQLLNDPGEAIDALRSLTALLRETARDNEIEPLMVSMQHRFTGDEKKAFAELRADQLADGADSLLAQNKNGPAIGKLEQSIQFAPTAAWNRFKLARTYRRLGLAQLGSEVMDEGFAASKTPEMSYATALYRNSIDDVAGAIGAMDRIPDPQRTEGMRNLANNLQAQQLLAEARRLFGNGERQAGEQRLTAAAALVPNDPDMLATLGKQWIAEGQSDRGLHLLRSWLDANPGDPAPDARLRYGNLLANAERETALTDWLAQIRQISNLTPEQAAQLEDQSLRQALRMSDAAIAAKDYPQANAILAAVDPSGQADRRWWLQLADLRRTEGRYAQARAAVAPLLAKAPDDHEAVLTLARIEEQSGQPKQALALVRRVVQDAPPDHVDTRLSAARRLVALRQAPEAAGVVDALQLQFPANPDVTIQRGRILQAMGQYDDAQATYQNARSQEPAANVQAGPYGTPAQKALFDLDQRRQPMIETALIPSYKSGTEGVSSLRGIVAPVYIQVPDGYKGHWLFHADTVRLDAGTLNPSDPGASFSDASSTGTFAAYKTGTTFSATPGAADVALSGPLHQRATGVAFGIGFETDDWRADVGTTPIGFPVQNVVGGFRFRVPNDLASLSVNFSRRAQTSSLLSYAGAHDPVTNQIYGGVVRSGVDIYVSKDIGKASVFAGLGAGVLTGRNVQTNQAETLRTGFSIPLLTSANWQLDSGLVGNYWHYGQNLRFYTFGQGGYYSPQRYLSIAVPLDWTARYGKASWELNTSVGLSRTREASSSFFPTNAALQAGALQNTVNNTNPESVGGGLSYSISAVFQYALSQHLTGGFSISIDRSHDYAPSSAMIYLRYAFNPGHEQVAFPRAVKPYSDY